MKKLFLLSVMLVLLGCRSVAGGQGRPAGLPTGGAPNRQTATPGLTPDINEPMRRYQIDQSKYPDAECNDGTAPVFYFRPGFGDGANRWLIWFQGGGSCFSTASCTGRRLQLTSSKAWMADDKRFINGQGEKLGFFYPQADLNPDFYNWNHVLLVYCSSDLWSGTRQAGPEANEWRFKGHYIVAAFLSALQDPAVVGVPNMAAATHIMFSGSSAGAYGLLYNIDRMRERFPQAVVKGVFDSALYPVDLADIDGIGDQILWDTWQPQVDQSCVAEHEMNPVVCMVNGYLLSDQISTPIFVHQDQRDEALLAIFNPERSTERDCLFATSIRQLLSAHDGVFSPNRGFHTIVTSPRFFSTTIRGYSMAEVLGNWYFERGQPTTVIESYYPPYIQFLCT